MLSISKALQQDQFQFSNSLVLLQTCDGWIKLLSTALLATVQTLVLLM